MKNSSSEYAELNGTRQFISFLGNNTKLPILLYLHGGPGDAALPLVFKYNYELANKFIVVVWEQRGAGKSYYAFNESEDISINLFINDLHHLVVFLLKKFSQQKLYILGHSWGSVLGLQFVNRYPQLVHAYYGCGQVVNMKIGFEKQYDFVLEESKRRNKAKIVEKLERTDITLSQESWLEDLLFITKLVVKYGRSIYGKSTYNTFVKDFILSSTYSLKDLLNRERGSLQSINFLWQELMTIDFSSHTSFDVPITFLEGRHDQHVSSSLVDEYYTKIVTPKELVWFENSSHFPQWEEHKKFNQVIRPLNENDFSI